MNLFIRWQVEQVGEGRDGVGQVTNQIVTHRINSKSAICESPQIKETSRVLIDKPWQGI